MACEGEMGDAEKLLCSNMDICPCVDGAAENIDEARLPFGDRGEVGPSEGIESSWTGDILVGFSMITFEVVWFRKVC